MRTDGITRRGLLWTIGAAVATGTSPGRGAPSWAAAPARTSDRGASLRFGVQTHPTNTTYAELRSTWKEIDDLGYHSAFVFDHLMPIAGSTDGPCFEGWALLSALAAETRRVRVGVLVTGNTYRYPPVLAKLAATVDHVSNGRLILGLGAAWFEAEHQAYGIPFHTPGERARRLVEAVKVLKLLFTEKKATFDGKYYDLQAAPFEPKTVQKPHPPILIGGMGPKVIQPLAAREADIWHFFAGSPEEAKAAVEKFDRICRKVGRDPADVVKSVSLRGEALAGSAKVLRERCRAFADAGIGLLTLSIRSAEERPAIRRFAKEVLPAFAAGEQAGT
jgi:F420-dependent oxidoreductase-like protein